MKTSTRVEKVIELSPEEADEIVSVLVSLSGWVAFYNAGFAASDGCALRRVDKAIELAAELRDKYIEIMGETDEHA